MDVQAFPNERRFRFEVDEDDDGSGWTGPFANVNYFRAELSLIPQGDGRTYRLNGWKELYVRVVLEDEDHKQYSIGPNYESLFGNPHHWPK